MADTAKPKPRKATVAKRPSTGRNGQRSGQPRGKPPGLPTALLREVPGSVPPMTVHTVLVNHLRLGVDVAVAAGRAKVSRGIVHDWLNEGMRVAAAVEAGKITPADLTPKDAAVYRFALDAIDAVSEAEASAASNLVRLARGQATRRRVVTTYEGAGELAKEVGRVETEETLAPDRGANVFLLERRFAERWNRRQQLEVTLASDDIEGPVESPLPALLSVLADLEAREARTAELLEGSG